HAVSARRNPQQQPEQQEPWRRVEELIDEKPEPQPDQYRRCQLKTDSGGKPQRRQHAGFPALIRWGHQSLRDRASTDSSLTGVKFAPQSGRRRKFSRARQRLIG